MTAGEAADVTLNVTELKEEDLTAEQKKAIENKEVALVISAEILSNGQNISDFKGGTVTVKIPFTPAEGAKGGDYKILYVADDGSIEEIPTTYVDGYLVAVLKHFSDYVVVKAPAGTTTPAKPGTDAPKTGDTTSPVLWIALMVVAVGGLVGTLLLAKKRKAQ